MLFLGARLIALDEIRVRRFVCIEKTMLSIITLKPKFGGTVLHEVTCASQKCELLGHMSKV